MTQDEIIRDWASKWAFVREHAPRLLAACISSESTSPSDRQNVGHAVDLAELLYRDIETRRESERPDGT